MKRKNYFWLKDNDSTQKSKPDSFPGLYKSIEHENVSNMSKLKKEKLKCFNSNTPHRKYEVSLEQPEKYAKASNVLSHKQL